MYFSAVRCFVARMLGWALWGHCEDAVYSSIPVHADYRWLYMQMGLVWVTTEHEPKRKEKCIYAVDRYIDSKID